MKLIYVASPFRGGVDKNIQFAKQSIFHAVLSGTVPVAPHLLYTQILDDTIEDERNLGIQTGLSLLEKCDELWVYGDTFSEGMKEEVEFAIEFSIPIRFIPTSEISTPKYTPEPPIRNLRME